MATIGNPRVRGPNGSVSPGSDVLIKTLISHPMETGLRKNPDTGQPIPAHFIEVFEAQYLGETVMKADWTGAVSKNPFFRFKVRATATGPLKVMWTDNQGGSWSEEIQIQVG